MKQQFLGILSFVFLGLAGVALSQPKVVSFGAGLLGLHLPCEMVELSTAEEFELPPRQPQLDFFESWNILDETTDIIEVGEVETSVPTYQDYPVYEIPVKPEPSESIADSDIGFAYLSAPLTSEMVDFETFDPASFDEEENDFGALNQNLTQAAVVPEAVVPEEIVLYEAVKRPGKPIAAPSDSVQSQPQPQPPPMPAVVTDFGANQRFHVDANLVEIVPCPGAETVARVGTEIILGCDILPEAKKIAYFDLQDKLKKIPPEERQKISAREIQELQEATIREVFPMILKEYVRYTLLYCDFASARKPEEIQLMEKRVGDMFEANELPRLMRQFEAGNRLELNNALERLIGSSIEREKTLFIRKMVGVSMIRGAIDEAEGECTYEEMYNYYNEHKVDFFHKARAKWLQLTVNITPSFPKDKAREKIVWMGNHVAGAVPFEQVARDHSDGLAAKNGGFNDWVSKGSLVSEILEQAVFQGPVGNLSPIIEDRNAFHIVKVLQREEEYYTPFLQAQSDIKKKIKDLRRNKKEAEYFAELSRKFQPETYENNVTNFSKPESKTALPQGTGTSLHAR